jgi:hypothetical protein
MPEPPAGQLIDRLVDMKKAEGDASREAREPVAA